MESEELVLKAKAEQLMYIRSSITFLGLVAGIIYASRTGGGAFRYIGYGIAVSSLAGLLGFLATMSASNKLLEKAKNLDNNKPV